LLLTFLSPVLASYDHGRLAYDEFAKSRNEALYNDIYPDVWAKVFQPSQPVRFLIDKEMKTLNLKPRQYVTLHIRSMYDRHQANDRRLLENAVHCAMQIRPELPLLIATDNTNMTNLTLEYANLYRKAVARQYKEDPLHLDRGTQFLSVKANQWTLEKPSRYYDTFVDLYLMSYAACVVHGTGGFGQWASLMASCNHHHHPKRRVCQFQRNDPRYIEDQQRIQSVNRSLGGVLWST
jgi:hypothetical protein